MRKSSHSKILKSASRNQHGKPGIQYLITSPADDDPGFSRAWSVHASQINPKRKKVSNFGDNKFRTQNLKFFTDSAMNSCFILGNLIHLIWVFIPILQRMNSSTRHTFRGYLQSRQFPSFGRWTAPVVRRSWLAHGTKEMKQTFNLICSEFLP